MDLGRDVKCFALLDPSGYMEENVYKEEHRKVACKQ